MLSENLLRESPEERLVDIQRTRTRDDVIVVNEIYASLQGESTHAGRPCVFVRTTGCHLRCSYCDSEHAFHEGEERAVADVLSQVLALKPALVELTGGEPLLQKGTHALVKALLDAGREVLIETSGGVGVEGVDRRARIILDVKTPGSGEHERNVWKNLAALKPGHDEVKLVICDAGDFAWAKEQLERVPAGVTVLMSPSYPGMPAAALAEWILRDELPVRFQLQMHRVLWGDRRGV